MNLFGSALFKTLIVGGLGSIAPLVLSVADHPTGGMAGALSTNPVYAAAWGGFSYFLHNLYDHYLGTPIAPK